MKKISIFSFLFILIINILQAQETQQRYELTAEDILRWHELSERLRTSTPPDAPVVSIAEFERCQGVLIAYPGYSGFGIPNNLIAEMSQLVTVTVAVSTTSQQNSVRNQLQNVSNINMNNINFVVGSIDSYWTRDYGPWFILDGNDEFGVADFTYNRPSRPNDDAHMAIMTNFLNINHFDFPVVHTGGNYMSDGYGTAASDDLLYNENDDLTQAQILQYCNDYLGINNYHVTIDPQGDYIAHIDCWGKFLGVDKILIAQLPTGASNYQNYEDVANYFANATTPWGNKYKVYRVFEPGSVVSNARTPYTNSLILNDHVFVPVTGTSYDDDAIAVYQQAMPGYTIVPIMEKSSTPWENTDALHCRTHEIPDLQMLRITHYPTLGSQPYDSTFILSASIKNLSHQNLVADSVRIYYRITDSLGTRPWQDTPMTLVSGETWAGAISGITDTCQVEYYLFAKDESGRRETYPLIGEPDPFIFTVGHNLNPDVPTDTIPSDTIPTDTTSIDTNDLVMNIQLSAIHILPNPAQSQFVVTTPTATSMTVFNAFGQIIYRENTIAEERTVNCSNWPAGLYIVRVELPKGQYVNKKLTISR